MPSINFTPRTNQSKDDSLMNQLIPEQGLIECDAYDCNQLATEIVGIGAGDFGTIELIFCGNCALKFRGTEA